MPITVDATRFTNMVREIAAARGKTEAETLNKGMVTILIGSGSGDGLVQLTPKATKERIISDRTKGGSLVKSATNVLKKSGFFKSGQKHTRAEINAKIKEVCAAILKAKVKSRSYIAASWLNASFSLRGISGVHHRGRKVKGTIQWPSGTAAKSFCIPATESNLTVRAFSYARGAELISGPHVQTAFNNAALDMEIYFIQKMAKAMAKHLRR